MSVVCFCVMCVVFYWSSLPPGINPFAGSSSNSSSSSSRSSSIAYSGVPQTVFSRRPSWLRNMATDPHILAAVNRASGLHGSRV